MYETTAQQHAEVIARDRRDRRGHGTLITAVEQSTTGVKPTRTFAVTFAYVDGRKRTFDGDRWTE